MRADTQLDYAIFQLTPTRTRCELHIVAKGLTYKLASGLLKPFISHLRAAEEQLAKGGYSIRLEPPDGSRAPWFTKGTMERFVRFVSTPEVLERVSSVEIELLELEETTRQQTADANEGSGTGQVDISSKTAVSQLPPGGRLAGSASVEKFTKVFSDGAEIGSEESSKQRLLRALDARRMMLQKEQGMAFARALAAGFNVDNMDDLVLFAECFGANRLREACTKFMAFVKKRQEAGLGLEDLELMAAESVQADMLYMGAMGGNAMGITWPHPQGNGHDLPVSPTLATEGKQASEDSTEKGPEEQTGLKPAGGDSEVSSGVVKGHPMMGAWQGQPHGQFMPGVPPYAAMHPGMSNPSFGFTGPMQPGQMGLPYPHYLGGPYMPPPYPDGNGWQAHSHGPPQYWPGNQAGDSTDGVYHRSPYQHGISPPSAREREAQESSRHDDDWHDNGEDYSNDQAADVPRRLARRSASPRRRSASPMRKVQIGRTGGSKRSGMVVIKNINYITPKSKQQDTRDEDGDSENSDSWSEDDESDEDGTLKNSAETLRTSIEDAVGIVEGKNHAMKDGRRRPSKKDRKKAASKDLTNSAGDDDARVNNAEDNKHASEQKEYVWVIDRHNKQADESTKLLPEDGIFSENAARMQGSFDPTSENGYVEKKDGVDAKDNQLAEDSLLLSQNNGYSRGPQSHSFDMFEQEHREGKKEPVVDNSYILVGGGNVDMARSHAIMEPDFDFSSKAIEDSQENKKLPDDSFIVLERQAEKEGTNRDWRMSLNLESEMPFDQNPDVSESAREPHSFEPDDLFMAPDRGQDTYKRSWSSPLDYDMQVLAADLMDNGNHVEDKEVSQEGDGPIVEEQEDQERPPDPVPRRLSEKEAKAKAMKEMLERRRSVGGARPGRPNPLAEAQLRAEKLRQYKAGLQKSKKEKEEEERKRIEDLRIQRQQRIAARSNPGGISPSSPSLPRSARTPPSAASKPSSKFPTKASPLSPSVNRERLANGSRLVRSTLDSPKPMENLVSRSVSRSTLDSPKPTENPVTRSVSSVTELRREAKKPTTVLRASTGSQPLSPSVRNERNGELNLHSKPNGRVEHKVGRVKSGRADDRISRTDSGLAEERIGKSESGRFEDKFGRTESGRTEGKECQSESGHAPEKAVFVAAARSVKRAAPQDGLALHASSPKSPTVDTKAVKKTPLTPSKPTLAQKKTALTSTASVDEKAKTEPKAFLPSQKEEQPKLEVKLERPMKTAKSEDPCPVIASENGSCNESGSAHQEGMSHALEAAHAETVNHENGFPISSSTMAMVENTKEDLSNIGSSIQAESIAGSDDRQLEVEVSSSVGEECHARVAHVSPSEGNHPELTEEDMHTEGHLVGDYSPPFAPPSEYSMSPTVHLAHDSPTSQQEFLTESNLNEASSTTRSRKKWGDSKAKGLKRLLLLGRKSGRSSAQNAADIASEGDEEDLPSSNGKNSHTKLSNDLDNFSDQAVSSVPAQADLGSVNSSSKGSRSIFSLSTFRGKSTVKA